MTAWHIPYLTIPVPKVGIALLALLMALHLLRRRSPRTSRVNASVALATCLAFTWIVVFTYFHALDQDPYYYRLTGARFGVASAVIAATAEFGAFTASWRSRRRQRDPADSPRRKDQ